MTTDAANLAGLLRREPRICMNCASAKLVVSLTRVHDAAEDLAKTVTVRQEVDTCPICGNAGVVLSLETR